MGPPGAACHKERSTRCRRICAGSSSPSRWTLSEFWENGSVTPQLCSGDPVLSAVSQLELYCDACRFTFWLMLQLCISPKTAYALLLTYNLACEIVGIDGSISDRYTWLLSCQHSAEDWPKHCKFQAFQSCAPGIGIRRITSRRKTNGPETTLRMS